MPRTAIAQLAKLIGQELESGAGPSEQARRLWRAQLDAQRRLFVTCPCAWGGRERSLLRRPRR
jgi:hypothetical protein